MKSIKIAFLALVPVLLAGCVVDDSPYNSGYSSDTYYVDSYGHRHYRHHHRHYEGGGAYYGAPANQGGYRGGNAAAPVAGGNPSVPQGGGYSGGSANPSKPVFGRSSGASPMPSNPAPAQPPAQSPAAPAHKVIITPVNRPNPSLPSGPSSTHVMQPTSMKAPQEMKPVAMRSPDEPTPKIAHSGYSGGSASPR